MADSLKTACNELRRDYDVCFNRWLEGYLSVANPKSGEKPLSQDEKMKALRVQADLYEEQCGKSFRDYQQCLLPGIKEAGLVDVLEAARTEEPLIRPNDTAYPGFGR